MNTRTAVVLTSAVVAASVALTGCNPGSGKTTYYKSGPAGQVVDRDIEDGYYELETKDYKGKKHEFNVSFSVYNDCHLYRYYPSCVHSKNLVKPKPTKTSKSRTNKLPSWKSPKKATPKKKSGGFSFGGSSKSKTKKR